MSIEPGDTLAIRAALEHFKTAFQQGWPGRSSLYHALAKVQPPGLPPDGPPFVGFPALYATYRMHDFEPSLRIVPWDAMCPYKGSWANWPVFFSETGEAMAGFCLIDIPLGDKGINEDYWKSTVRAAAPFTHLSVSVIPVLSRAGLIREPPWFEGLTDLAEGHPTEMAWRIDSKDPMRAKGCEEIASVMQYCNADADTVNLLRSLVTSCWLGELYRIAWEGKHPLLTAPQYRMYARPDGYTVSVRVKHDDGPDCARFCRGLAFSHEFFSVLCDGQFDLFQASAWAVEYFLVEFDRKATSTTPISEDLQEAPFGASKPRRRRRAERKPVALTPQQTEALQLVGEHKGDCTAAARAAGKTRQAMRKLYKKGLDKMAKAGLKQLGKPKTQALPHDGRGQPIVTAPDTADEG